MTPGGDEKTLQRDRTIRWMPRLRGRLGRLIHERTLFVLVVLFSIAGAAMFWSESRVQASIIESTIREDAKAYSEALSTFRSLYTSEVIGALRGREIPITHDYERQEGAVPLPATLTLRLGEELGALGSGAHSRLYSPYPFPGHGEESGLRDEFARQAWEALEENPHEPFIGFEEVNGRPSLRYATADLMRAVCIDCHNNHPDSPKRDWGVGDLRGVLEVTLPMDAADAQINSELRRSVFFYLLMVAVAASVIALVLGRQRDTARELGERVAERTLELAHSNEELKSTQQKIIEEERLRVLGLMASGIAHEFNNALQPILGYSAQLLEHPELLDHCEEGIHSLGIINTEALNLRAAVRRLSQYNRRGALGVSRPARNVKELVDQAVLLSQPKWKNESLASGIEIEVEADLAPLPGVAIEESELRDVLTNLIFKAMETMPEGGTISIGAWTERDQVVLEVRDTGKGMTSTERQHCLEPFFASKDPGSTGLGLAVVNWIIDRAGGRIDIATAVDRGTRVRVWLPVLEDAQPANVEADTTVGEDNQPAVVRPLRVLLVEDKQEARQAIEAGLKKDGHRVELAVSGRDGIERFDPGAFDLVVTDYSMPEMNGYQLAQLIKALSPTTPIILLTGFGDEMKAFYEKTQTVDLVLTKPAAPAELRAAIKSLLTL